MFPGMGAPGWAELLIVGMIALLLFGKRLPEVARNLGSSITEFKNGFKDMDNEMQEISEEVKKE